MHAPTTVDQKRLAMFTLPDDFKETLLAVAMEITAKNESVYLTMVNDAYLPMTESWLCNTGEYLI